jgi:predicted RecA/RadA family phage recombinase
MKNFVQPGKSIDVPAPAGGSVSGRPVIIGSLIGIASVTAVATTPIAIQTTGVYTLPKTSALAIAIGDKLYWDATNNVVNKTASGNTLIGTAVSVAANPSDTVDVLLGPTTV